MTEEEEKLKLAPEEEAEIVPEGETLAPEGEAAEAPVAPDETIEPEPEPEPEPEVRTFTQEEVNALLGKTRMEARQRAREEYAAELRAKYGLETDAELDDLFGNGQRFEALNGEYESLNSSMSELRAENALLRSGIPEEKFDDVKAILAYNHLEVTPENIAQALTTHPEWQAQTAPVEGAGMMPPPNPPEPIAPAMGKPKPPVGRPAPSVVPKLGGEPQAGPGKSEEEQKANILKMFYDR